MGVRSHIGVQNVQKILFGADKGRSHKTSRSLIRGSLVAGTTVSVMDRLLFKKKFYTRLVGIENVIANQCVLLHQIQPDIFNLKMQGCRFEPP